MIGKKKKKIEAEKRVKVQKGEEHKKKLAEELAAAEEEKQK